MMRRALLPIFLLLSTAALAQQVPDPMSKGNANVMGVGGSINLSASTVMPAFTQSPGSMAGFPYPGWWVPGWWGTRGGQNAQWLFGSYAAPVITAGPPVAIGVVSGKLAATCDGISAQSGCNAALLVQNMGTAATTMVTSGITAYTETKSTSGVGTGNAQSGNFIAVASAGSQTGGMGIYSDGVRFSPSSFAYGAEISSANYADVSCQKPNYAGIGQCDSIWLVSRGLSTGPIKPTSSLLHLGLGNLNSAAWEGITVNNGAVIDTTFNDQSSSVASINIGGSHQTALRVMPGAGRVLIGTDVSYAGQYNSHRDFQFYGSGAQFGLYANNQLPPYLGFTKSKSDTVGVHAAVTAGTQLGLLNWFGSDGTAYQLGAQILVAAAAPISAGVVPASMSFWTTDTAGVNSARMAIAPEGDLLLPGRAVWGDTLISHAGQYNTHHDYQFYGPSGVQLGLYANNTLPPQLGFTKSNNDAVGVHTAVTDGTRLGQLSWSGSDGTAYQIGGMIEVVAKDPISTGIVPSQMLFRVTNPSGDLLDAIKITNVGAVEVLGSVTATSFINSTGGPLAAVGDATAPRVVYYGDSLTNGGYDRYVSLTQYNTGFTASGPTLIKKDFSTQRSGYGGMRADTGLTYAPEFLYPYYQSRSPLNIAMIWLGTNDIATAPVTTAAATWTRIQTLAAAAKAKGFKTCVGTSISRGLPAGTDTNLTALNGLITAGWSAAGINCLVNFASDPNLAPNGTNYANLTYYNADQVHLNEAGKQLAAAVAQAALNTYIATFTGPTVGEFNAPGNMTAAALATAGTIAGSLCRTATGTFIYKAGANCF